MLPVVVERRSNFLENFGLQKIIDVLSSTHDVAFNISPVEKFLGRQNLITILVATISESLTKIGRGSVAISPAGVAAYEFIARFVESQDQLVAIAISEEIIGDVCIDNLALGSFPRAEINATTFNELADALISGRRIGNVRDTVSKADALIGGRIGIARDVVSQADASGGDYGVAKISEG
jgi:hypothetical protein